MRYKVDSNKETVEVIEATGEELLKLAKEYPKYIIRMGTEGEYLNPFPILRDGNIGTSPSDPNKPNVMY